MEINSEAIVILVLLSFIIGVLLGVSLARPNYMR